MVIRRKSNIYKKYYEYAGQLSFFGHDNIHFKTVTLPKPQRFKNLCPKFNLKIIIKNKPICLKIVKLI